MIINATLINYLALCQRKMWLHYHGIRMEHTSDLVYEGKLVGEGSYEQRAEKNEQMEVWAECWVPTVGTSVGLSAKIDFFDAKRGIVHETKKSNAKERAHVAQVLFYMYVLSRNGVAVKEGLIEYPKLRQTERVEWDDASAQQVEEWIAKVAEVLILERCPAKLPISQCKNCSYYEYCWTSED